MADLHDPKAPDSTIGALSLLGFLTVLNTLNFVDRQLLASFANYIVPDLGLSNTEFAILTGPAFILFYAVAGLAMGIVADLVNRAKLIAVAVGIWSALTAASGLATGFVGLLVPRALIGIGEAALTPSALAMLGDRFAPRRLGLVSAIYYAGVPIGAGLSLFLAGVGGQVVGWRTCFVALGVVGLALSAVSFFVRDTPRPAVPRERAGARVVAVGFARHVAGSRKLQLVIGAGVMLHLLIGVSVFDQLWLVKERGFDRASIAIATGAITCVAGLAGNLYGGIFSDYWQERTGQSRLTLLMWTLIVLAPLVVSLRFVAPSSPLFWAGVFASAFQLGAMYGPLFSTLQELVPREMRSTGLAFAIFVQNVLGIGVGATLGGLLIDHLIGHGVDQPYSTAALVFVVISLSAIPLLWLASRCPDALMPDVAIADQVPVA